MLHRSTREHVDHAEQGLRILAEKIFKRGSINPWNRNVHSKAINE